MGWLGESDNGFDFRHDDEYKSAIALKHRAFLLSLLLSFRQEHIIVSSASSRAFADNSFGWIRPLCFEVGQTKGASFHDHLLSMIYTHRSHNTSFHSKSF